VCEEKFERQQQIEKLCAFRLRRQSQKAIATGTLAGPPGGFKAVAPLIGAFLGRQRK
jgi:hypothetical protein